MGQLPDGLEAAINGKGAGERVEVSLVNAFGAPSGVDPVRVKKNVLPKNREWEVGDGFPVELDNGEKAVLYVLEKKGSWITLTRDHPLAGQQLDFEVDIIDIRAATASEKAHGHAHGHAGHDHHH